MVNLFVKQDGKLYLLEGDKLIGVEIYTDKITKIEGTETVMLSTSVPYTRREVMAKLQITEENPYIFPIEEVKEIVATDEIKKSTRKSPRK